jgi:nucleoside-diphosphate-sugar epimerase
MRVLVTGRLGYIGTILAPTLVQAGQRRRADAYNRILNWAIAGPNKRHECQAISLAAAR